MFNVSFFLLSNIILLENRTLILKEIVSRYIVKYNKYYKKKMWKLKNKLFYILPK